MEPEVKLFIPSTEQVLKGNEQEITNYRDTLASQGIISWILTIN